MPRTFFQIWKFLLRTGVKLSPDGFYKLTGIFGHSTTFGYLQVPKAKIKEIINSNGSLKEFYLSRLADFMCKQRINSSLSNAELVILGLTKLLNESNSS